MSKDKVNTYNRMIDLILGMMKLNRKEKDPIKKKFKMQKNMAFIQVINVLADEKHLAQYGVKRVRKTRETIQEQFIRRANK